MHAIENVSKGAGDKPAEDVIIADSGEVRSFSLLFFLLLLGLA